MAKRVQRGFRYYINSMNATETDAVKKHKAIQKRTKYFMNEFLEPINPKILVEVEKTFEKFGLTDEPGLYHFPVFKESTQCQKK